MTAWWILIGLVVTFAITQYAATRERSSDVSRIAWAVGGVAVAVITLIVVLAYLRRS